MGLPFPFQLSMRSIVRLVCGDAGNWPSEPRGRTPRLLRSSEPRLDGRSSLRSELCGTMRSKAVEFAKKVRGSGYEAVGCYPVFRLMLTSYSLQEINAVRHENYFVIPPRSVKGHGFCLRCREYLEASKRIHQEDENCTSHGTSGETKSQGGRDWIVSAW